MIRPKNFTVHLYHGGEAPNEITSTNCIKTARLLVSSAEHGIIHDNLKGEIVE